MEDAEDEIAVIGIGCNFPGGKTKAFSIFTKLMFLLHLFYGKLILIYFIFR